MDIIAPIVLLSNDATLQLYKFLFTIFKSCDSLCPVVVADLKLYYKCSPPQGRRKVKIFGGAVASKLFEGAATSLN